MTTIDPGDDWSDEQLDMLTPDQPAITLWDHTFTTATRAGARWMLAQHNPPGGAQ